MYPNMPGMPSAPLAPIQTPAMPGLPVPPRPGVREALPGLIGLIAALVGGGRAGGAGFAQTWGQRLQMQEAERQEALRDQALMAQRQAEQAALAAQQRQQAKVKFLTDVQGQLSDFKTKAQADQFLDFAEQASAEMFPELGRGGLRRVVRYIAPGAGAAARAVLEAIANNPMYRGQDLRGAQVPFDSDQDGIPERPVPLADLIRLAPDAGFVLDERGQLYQPPVAPDELKPYQEAKAVELPLWTAEKGRPPITPQELANLDDRVRRRLKGPPEPKEPKGIPPGQQFQMTLRLQEQYDKIYQPIREMDRQLRLMKAGLAEAKRGNLNAGSQQILVTFQKVLDPTSVVRESEYARTPQGQALVRRLEGIPQRIMSGGPGVTIAELSGFVAAAEAMLQTMQGFAGPKRRQLVRTAEQFELDPGLIFEDAEPSTESDLPGGAKQAEPPLTADAPEGAIRTYNGKRVLVDARDPKTGKLKLIYLDQ